MSTASESLPLAAPAPAQSPFTSRGEDLIKAGDLVVLFSGPNDMVMATIIPGKSYHTKYGEFRHDDMIGRPFGYQLPTRSRNKGFIYLLRPSPELWTVMLPHRTQILYIADIAFVTQYLWLRPGSKIIEAGTGSGSFTHSVARTVAPNGHVYSFEFNEQRAAVAIVEFAGHGLDIVTPQQRDVCQDGFGLEDTVDAVFLDLPAPWEAIPHTKKTFKKSKVGRICCFSPCMEQVQKTCVALHQNGFFDIKMYETLIRHHDVRRVEFKDAPVGPVRSKKPVKRKLDEDDVGDTAPAEDNEEPSSTSDLTGDAFKSEAGVSMDIADEAESRVGQPSSSSGRDPHHKAALKKQRRKEELLKNGVWTARHQTTVRGHTSYLTFASYAHPSLIGEETKDNAGEGSANG
ncbi:tRNA methyltransferase complex GCD14 subunit [Gonapodya prolifera JEL478]|uniref:tRNA (adenine(58)-N(1))-methyltransferase catalytic subunit TRM61 n=1 Tax=Gonapodya prolifera (strain JEL478) TaxID=1344416 RepID=A0A139AFE2_GONPJ|nr:tRNA methyltransferase complex GCD14 subunit [Gonapodya prolifera JEL478]|eukprot:KXS15409.1 tRNA methyltransferase complex GCD14 subunit [Gonapodya prolifera JEL478]